MRASFHIESTRSSSRCRSGTSGAKRRSVPMRRSRSAQILEAARSLRTPASRARRSRSGARAYAAAHAAFARELAARRTAARRRHHARIPDRRRPRRRSARTAVVLSEGGHELSTSSPGTCGARVRAPCSPSGGGSLGWNGGAAIGAKLGAARSAGGRADGDGSYLFSQPSTVHWMARRYATPFLQVVYNNGGWKAPTRRGDRDASRWRRQSRRRYRYRRLLPSPTMRHRRGCGRRVCAQDFASGRDRAGARGCARGSARRAALCRDRCAARGALIAIKLTAKATSTAGTRARRWSGSTVSFPVASAAARH